MNQEAQQSQPVQWGPLWGDEWEQSSVVGVLVCHGMGQQVRFQTISDVASKLLDEVTRNGGRPGAVKVHLARAADQFIARAEVDWLDRSGQRHAVHVYEAYWAPLTEGRVSFWDTLNFLLSAARSGLWHSKLLRPTTFPRWMFGDWQLLRIGPLTWITILTTLVLMALVMILIGSAFAFAYVDVIPRLRDAFSFPPGLAWLTPLVPGSDELLHWKGFDLATIVAAAVRLIVWALALVGTYFVRYFAVQFIGDVAAYVSPYKSSKFDEVRRNIQKVGLDVGKVVYGLGPSGTNAYPNYSKIVVVGHSLGSVVAYDTLNALINLENTGAAPGRSVIDRTRGLLTFGSPLDKTAFIFRMQRKDSLREQMAAAMQPLIVDYDRFRPLTFQWINIWSKFDVISGSLEYYDRPVVPQNDPRHVHNMEDPQANKPLYAHVQYWDNRVLQEQLYGLVI